MILDSGICTIYARRNVAEAGCMPKYAEEMRCKSWYGELNFETSAAYPTERRRERQTAARIRILQCRAIEEDDVAVLKKLGPAEGASRFEITRAYHGTDEDSGELITDLTLAEVRT